MTATWPTTPDIRSDSRNTSALIYGFSAFDPDSSSPRGRASRAVLFNITLWTLFGLLQAATWLLSPIGERDALALMGAALFNAYLWALITPFIFPLAARLRQATMPPALSIALVVLLGVVLAAVVALLASALHGGIPSLADLSSAKTRFSFWALSRWYYEELVLYALVFGAGIAADMFRVYRAREREAAQLREATTRLEAERAELNARLAEARLAALRSQLNPHFLFNTLNAVSALVTKEPTRVRDMIALLSELLRSALQEADTEEVPLARELELLRLYLEILEIRYQGQLKTRIIVDEGAGEALVPRMILQPLVENAMKHGVAPASGDGFIEIRAQRTLDDLVLSVRDSGVVNGPAKNVDGAGVGLRLTQQRLAELYGPEPRFELVRAPEAGMIARVLIPYHTSSDLHVSAA